MLYLNFEITLHHLQPIKQHTGYDTGRAEKSKTFWTEDIKMLVSMSYNTAACTGLFLQISPITFGYWHQRADERHGKSPQGNQELLVVRDKV